MDQQPLNSLVLPFGLSWGIFALVIVVRDQKSAKIKQKDKVKRSKVVAKEHGVVAHLVKNNAVGLCIV